MASFLAGLMQLNAYNVTLVATVVIGLFALWSVARAYGIDAGFAIDAALLALLIGVIAGRAEVVVANADYFRERPLASLVDLQSGGLGQRSLTVAGIVSFVSVVALRRPRWRDYAAAAAPAVGLASAVAWAGFAFTGLGAGAEVDAPLLVSLPDSYGVVAPRLPVQFLMAGGHLLLAMAALLLFNRLLRPGLGLCLWGATTAALSALLDGFKAEPVYLASGVPRALVADAALAILWMIAAAVLLARRGPAEPSTEPTGEQAEVAEPAGPSTEAAGHQADPAGAPSEPTVDEA